MKSSRTPRQDFQDAAEWQIAMEREFKRLFDSGLDFCSEDVRESVGLPPGFVPNKFGAEWRRLLHSHMETLRITGLRRSTTKASRGRLLPIYRKVF